MYIWDFRARQRLRSLAPVMNDYGWLWWPNDIRGPWGLKLPDICLTGEEKPRKNSLRKLVPTRDRTRARCVVVFNISLTDVATSNDWDVHCLGEEGNGWYFSYFGEKSLFTLLNKFNPQTIIYDSLKFQTSIIVLQSFIRQYVNFCVI